ncbi:MAG: PEP-CTERM sorting domain-containing protein [Kiritimatiellae bacterium]|nr:PEP-CTERM sorting domain-containing protein [Kiritimatiellia bacterium]
MKKFLAIMAAMGIAGVASADLVSGDVAVISVNADGTKPFAWVALVDIPASTTINFTDNGILSTDLLRTGEGVQSWSHTSLVPAGTVITLPSSSVATPAWSLGTGTGSINFNPSGSGDQIIVFTGDVSTPTYIYGANWANSGWVAGATSSNNSKAPTANVHVGSLDNFQYAGTQSGTRNDLLAAISNPANWNTGSDSAAYTWTGGNFTVIPEPASIGLLGMFGVAALLRRRVALK